MEIIEKYYQMINWDIIPEKDNTILLIIEYTKLFLHHMVGWLICAFCTMFKMREVIQYNSFFIKNYLLHTNIFSSSKLSADGNVNYNVVMKFYYNNRIIKAEPFHRPVVLNTKVLYFAFNKKWH